MKRFTCSGSLSFILASMIATAALLFPAVAHSQNPEWINFTYGLPSDCVWALAIDAGGNKWIGTAWRGLAVYREGGVIL